MRAGFCGGFMAQWLWRLQSDTVGSSPAVAHISLFSYLPEQVEFQLNFCNFQNVYMKKCKLKQFYKTLI